MCKTLAILMIPIMLSSCSTIEYLTKNKIEENKVYQHKLEKDGFTQVDGELIPNKQLATPDSTKTIIVYNVVESDKGKKGLSDETWRSFIAQFFSTISTIFALVYGTTQN